MESKLAQWGEMNSPSRQSRGQDVVAGALRGVGLVEELVDEGERAVEQGHSAIANERLAILPDGRVAYTFKKRWRDGSAAVVFDPLTFLERLAALAPRPRKKLVNYFGVFAAAASWRDRVVPLRPPSPPPPPIAYLRTWPTRTASRPSGASASNQCCRQVRRLLAKSS